jgi:prolipoprotein diacylglyceryltransferase
MAEAGMAAYGAVVGVFITLAIVLFSLRGKGHPDPLE